MQLNHRIGKIGAAILLATAGLSAHAAQKVCVYDLLGASGDLFNMTKDYIVAMQRHGVSLELKAYNNEGVATEDFRTGQCDAVIATAFRTRQFNAVAASIDTLGATTIVRDGKIDMASSYDVVRKLIQTYSAASPQVTKLMTEGNYEVGGIVPLGAAYPVVNDRKINTVEALAGKKIAAFDYDKAQGAMIQKIGAQPVSVDVTNIGPRFNNGFVDMVTLPAVAYKPFELYKGIGTKGGIGRFPIMIPTVQLIFNKAKFPEGFGLKSRQYWAGQFDHAMSLIKKAEAGIPAATWDDLPPENIPKYVLMLREARIDIAKQGLYNKQTLNIIKRARCSVNGSDAECASKNEIE